MPRTLVSVVAGGLVVVGGFAGWQQGSRADESRGVERESVERPTEGLVSSRDQRSSDPAASSTTTASPLTTKGTDPGRSCTTPGPTSAEGADDLLQGMDDLPTAEGGDHGGSIALADGRRMFVFGDTIRASGISPFLVRNSVLVADGGCLQALEVDDEGPAIPDRGDLGYWPMSMRAVEVPGGTTVQVVTAGVRRTGLGAYETVGSNLATFEVPTGRMPRLTSHRQLGTSTNDPRVPTWGAALWESGGWVYVYGTTSNRDKSTFGWSLRVARTRPEDLADTTSWEYWGGSAWAKGEPAAARRPEAALIPADGGVSHVLSVIERDGSWYAVSKVGDYVGDTLAVWKAPSPTGPFVKHEVRDLSNSAEIRRYTPLAHPDLETSSGRLLVSWSESPTATGPYYTTPSLYRPRFAEIDLP